MDPKVFAALEEIRAMQRALINQLLMAGYLSIDANREMYAESAQYLYEIGDDCPDLPALQKELHKAADKLLAIKAALEAQ